MDLDYPKQQLGPAIVPGRTYRYTLDLPRGCKGALYRVERFVLDVPSYTQRVLVECIDGKDAGLWFTCSLANFAVRYAEAAEPAGPGVCLDLTEKGSGA